MPSGRRIATVIFGESSGGSVINGAIQFDSALAAASNVEDKATGTTAATTNTINATIQLANGRSWFKSSVVGHTLEFKGTISGIGTGGVLPVENGIRIYGPGTVKFNHNSNNTTLATPPFTRPMVTAATAFSSLPETRSVLSQEISSLAPARRPVVPLTARRRGYS